MFVGLVHALANEYQPQQQETMTNRVRHVSYIRTQKECGSGHGFLSLKGGAGRSRSPCLPYHHMVVLGRIPPLNVRDRGKVAGFSLPFDRPGHLFHSTFGGRGF